jgi:sodium/potassium-transporting ATPase subunit alpha
LDAHSISIEELLKRFKSDLETGLTTEAVEESRKSFGFNKVKDKSQKSPILIFLKNIFGGFALVLWIGSLLCFLAYGLRASTFEHIPIDNLYLGIALVFKF